MDEENGSNYRPITQFSGGNNSSGGNFGKKIIAPFVCGVVGASLVVGVCFGIPNIRNTILGTNNTNNSIINNTNTSNGEINTNFANLEEYS